MDYLIEPPQRAQRNTEKKTLCPYVPSVVKQITHHREHRETQRAKPLLVPVV
jgi:hypothetical protein